MICNRLFYLLLVFPSIVIACGSRPTERILVTKHFRFVYTPLDDGRIQEIADSVEKGYEKITRHLKVENMPVVTVHFYENAVMLNKANPEIPVWAVGTATGVQDIHIISPNDPKQDFENMVRNTAHEFAHCVSMHINLSIANNPRWLWESIALYEANFPWDPKSLDYLVAGKPPTLTQLNQFEDTRLYQVGYFIGQYICEIHGPDKLRDLIANNGNIQQTLQMDDESFTKAWFAFVQKK